MEIRNFAEILNVEQTALKAVLSLFPASEPVKAGMGASSGQSITGWRMPEKRTEVTGMKKRLLALAVAAAFTTPAFAAENTDVVINGERQAGQAIGNIFEENALSMLPVRQMAARCGITAESGSAAIPLVKSIAAQAGMAMRWNADTKTAYFMDENRILYESGEWKAGVLLPRGCAGNSFRIAETQANGTDILHFFDPAGEMLVFSLMRLDLEDWENEIKENFAAPYSEVYRDHEEILLCVNASDVQYDPDNPEQKAEYETLLAYKEEICASFYTFTA